ncbi:hypothetical protein okayama3_02100 [Yersinia pseudotuberculosis]|uniref:hypothetical protein n=1 Tax=Yersinia pseudotuberculosis TaxID=633 RepID=UPI0005E807E2|nr:hypothetical protein [Yersinia pseudotuberculosis]CNL59115.1 Uncharacterised protein [Yersinia pseudotuberculosis]
MQQEAIRKRRPYKERQVHLMNVMVIPDLATDMLATDMTEFYRRQSRLETLQ